MSSRYWASSRPFNAIRNWFGIQKPEAAQWGEWDDWRKATQRDFPVGYWLTEKLPHLLQKVPETVVDPFHSMGYYIRNRWHRQTHVLRTSFKPGTYHDFRERILDGLMTSLVDYVEVEKAWMQHIWNADENPVKLGKGGRSKELGLKYLEWEMTLNNPALPDTQRSDQQAETARTVYEVYNWWTVIRPARPDPYEASGYDALCAERKDDDLFSFFDERKPKDPEYESRMKEALNRLREMEEQYDDEDNLNLHKIINVRLGLWT